MEDDIGLVVYLMLLCFLFFAQVIMQSLLYLEAARRIFVEMVELALEILGFAIDLRNESEHLVFVLDVVLDSLKLLVLAIDL